MKDASPRAYLRRRNLQSRPRLGPNLGDKLMDLSAQRFYSHREFAGGTQNLLGRRACLMSRLRNPGDTVFVLRGTGRRLFDISRDLLGRFRLLLDRLPNGTHGRIHIVEG